MVDFRSGEQGKELDRRGEESLAILPECALTTPVVLTYRVTPS